MNFANHVDGAARDAPEKTALSDPERSVTFEQFVPEQILIQFDNIVRKSS